MQISKWDILKNDLELGVEEGRAKRYYLTPNTADGGKFSAYRYMLDKMNSLDEQEEDGKQSSDKNVDTYDSDFTLEEIVEQTEIHFKELAELMSNDSACGLCKYFNGEVGDDEQFCDELESYVSEKFNCNRYSKQ